MLKHETGEKAVSKSAKRWSRPAIAVVGLTLSIFVLSAVVVAQDDALVRAKKSLDEGAYSEALAQYEKLLADPTRQDYDVFMGTALALFHLGTDDRRAAGLLEEAKTKARDRHEPLLYQGLVLERTGRAGLERGAGLARGTLRDAVAYYRDAAELMKDPFNAYYWASEVLATLGDFDGAALEIGRAVKVRPDNVAALTLQCRFENRRGRHAVALTAADKILALDPGHVEARLLRLGALARLGRVDDVEKILLDVVAPDVWGGSDAPFQVVRAAWDKPVDNERLIRVFDRVAKTHTEVAVANYFLAEAQLRAERYEAAIEASAKYSVRHPEHVEPLIQRSWAWLQLGRLEKAHAAVRASLVLAPSDPRVADQAGRVAAAYVEAKRYADAVRLQELVVTARPDNARIRRGYAVLLKEVGRLDEAVAVMGVLTRDGELAIEDQASYLNDLGLFLKGAGQRDLAKKTFRKAFEVSEFQLDARDNLAVMLMDEGDFDGAEKLLDEALALHAASAEPGDLPRLRTRYYRREVRRRRRSL